MAYIVNTKIENQTDGYSLDAKNVRGGFNVVTSVDQLTTIPSATVVTGTLCYCSDDKKFYQYDGTAKSTDITSWKEIKLVNEQGGLIYKEKLSNIEANITLPGDEADVDSLEMPLFAYGNGRLVLWGHNNGDPLAWYSDDCGETWEDCTLSDEIYDNQILATKIVFGNNMFIGVTRGGQSEELLNIFLYSYDGISWEARSHSGQNQAMYWKDVAYTDGMFMLLGKSYDDYFMKFSIGKNIDSLSNPDDTPYFENSDFDFYTVVGGNGKFLTIADEAGGAFVNIFDVQGKYISDEQLSFNGTNVKFIGGKFVAWQGSEIQFSDDGQNWTGTVRLNTTMPDEEPSITDIFYIDDAYFMVSNHIQVYKYDGSDFSLVHTFDGYEEEEDVFKPEKILQTDKFILGYRHAFSPSHSTEISATTNGADWSTTINTTVVEYTYLEQAGEDVTTNVSSIISPDLSNYYNKQDVNNLLQELDDAIDGEIESAVEAMLLRGTW